MRRGDRVALFMHNSPQFVIAYYGILRADAAVVPINCMNTTGELEQLLRDAGATTIITAQELQPRVEPLLGTKSQGKAVQHSIVACYRDYFGDYAGDAAASALPEALAAPRMPIPKREGTEPQVTPWHEVLEQAHAPAPHAAGPDDLALICYTSGTTGKPKGCMHRHRGVMHSTVAIAHWHDVRQHSLHARRAAAVPRHRHAELDERAHLRRLEPGAAAALEPRSRVRRHRASPGDESHHRARDDRRPDHELRPRRATTCPRCASSAAAARPCPKPWPRDCRKSAGLTYLEGYGMTETLAPTHINPGDRPKAHCLGIPIFDTDARIIDPQTLAELPQGAVGEIIVSGPQVLEEYWNKPEENAACFLVRDGKKFLRTGDLARVDEDGYFHFVDRLKRMINAAGFKVWPAEVEALLYGHPGVQEACVIGKHDPRSGEVVKALVVPREAARATLAAEELIAWSSERMAAYKVPREVEFVASLPKSATGKIDWRLLQEQEAARS